LGEKPKRHRKLVSSLPMLLCACLPPAHEPPKVQAHEPPDAQAKDRP
jgi:hypothetical protein